jgi:hypothetical protein
VLNNLARLRACQNMRRESAKQDAKEFKKIGNPTGFFIFFASSFAFSRLRGALFD